MMISKATNYMQNWNKIYLNINKFDVSTSYVIESMKGAKFLFASITANSLNFKGRL